MWTWNRFMEFLREEYPGLPMHKEVCSRCRGTGKHVNPAIDGNGISPEQFAEDPDFEEAYFAGVYDVRCEECNGENVVDAIDWDRLDDETTRNIEIQIQDFYNDRAMERMERQMGC